MYIIHKLIYIYWEYILENILLKSVSNQKILEITAIEN